MPARTSETVLDRRALNRTLLERQMLLRRRRVPALDAVERLVGLQAQVPRDPYVALWSRLDRFRPAALAEPMARREALRMTLLRGTLHLVTATDAVGIRPVIQRVMERTYYGSSPLRAAAGSVNEAELLSTIRTLLAERPRTRAELGKALAGRWPDVDTSSLSFAMYLVPIVQVTPRGIWGRTGSSAFTTLEAWVQRPLDGSDDPAPLILRYLAAFGPSTVADAQAWSGLSGLRPAFEALRPRLRILHDEPGRELFDVPGAPYPHRDTPAPVRFLPEYDNVALGHKDRSRITHESVAQWTEVGWGGLLVDGFAAGRWKLDSGASGAVLRIEPFGRMGRPEREAVSEEGARLALFLAPDAAHREVRFGTFSPAVARR